MTAGEWILIYLAVSLVVALDAWLQSRIIDLETEGAYLVRLRRDMERRALERATEKLRKLARIFGEEVSQAMAAAAVEAERLGEAFRRVS